MLKEKEIQDKMTQAYADMTSSKTLFGKEIFQKRIKPIFEGYLTAMATVLECSEEERTEIIRKEV